MASDDIVARAQALYTAGALADAEALLLPAVAGAAPALEVLLLLGTVLCARGEAAAAETWLMRACEQAPQSADAWRALGLSRRLQGNLGPAIVAYERGLALAPDDAALHVNLGVALRQHGRRAEAIAHFCAAIAAAPRLAEAHDNLGNCYLDAGEFDKARLAYLACLRLTPRNVNAAIGLAKAVQKLGKLGLAVEVLETARKLNPSDVGLLTSLGAALHEVCRYGAAIDVLRHALPAADDRVCEPSLPLAAAVGNLLAAQVYDPQSAPGSLRDGAREIVSRFAPPEPTAAPRRDLDPDRALRLGWLSSDLRNHSVARNLQPLVSHLDPRRFQQVFYSDVRTSDAVTDFFRARATGWRDTRDLTDSAVAELVRQDGIDILVVLAGRFDDNRPLFALRRASPIQISFHDVATSGLPCMDYFIADPYLVPRRHEASFTERVLYLPSFYVHDPIGDAPPVSPLPAARTGAVTFGCLNNPVKINDRVLDLWARVLAAVPRSRLLLKYLDRYASPDLQGRMRAPFAARGIAADRLVMLSRSEQQSQHLAAYRDIDVALDPFPFSGSTTSFEALWMGVPVLTLPGETAASRWTGAMLHALKLDCFIATSESEFVERATTLAASAGRLSDLRSSLRDRLAASPLCDGPRRARQLARLLRAVWRRYAASAR
jgi:predicted O-linked N-acetylglucosamine transferase (SPINDLY family)